MHTIQKSLAFDLEDDGTKSLKPPAWFLEFAAALRNADLSPVTVKGYLHDLKLFLQWHSEAKDQSITLEKLSAFDLINYRQYLINVCGFKPTTVNRRLEALRRLCGWAWQTKRIKHDVSKSLKPVRFARNLQPVGLVEPEVHALLRVAGSSEHGLASRNYALVQLMLQTGLRVGEVAQLTAGDADVRERSGMIRVKQGKGLRHREVPLNATARRALRSYLTERAEKESSNTTTGTAKKRNSSTKGKKQKTHQENADKIINQEDEPLFISERGAAMPVRTIQAVITSLGKKAKITRVKVSAHTLRHTFALNYLKQNPGKLVELAALLGHESLDTTAVYTRPAQADLAADLERSRFNVYG